MSGLTDENRQRVALALVGLSVGLILLGFGLILSHMSLEDEAAETVQPVKMDKQALARLMRAVLLWALVLVLTFGVSTLAFLRWSRHFRRWMFHKPSPPTASADVWAMHKLPEGALEAWGEEAGPSDDPNGNDRKDQNEN